MNVFFLKAGSHTRAYSCRTGSESSKPVALDCPPPTERAVWDTWSPCLLSYKWRSSGILRGILNSCLCLGKIRHLGDIGPTFSRGHQGEVIGGHNPVQGWEISRRLRSSLTPIWSHNDERKWRHSEEKPSQKEAGEWTRTNVTLCSR